MPQLGEGHNEVCDYCGALAQFVSVNTKKFRCEEKVTRCPALIKQQEESRQKKWSNEERRAHMKRMSDSGNSKIRELSEDANWRENKSRKISQKCVERGGHNGYLNPMFGKSHKSSTKEKQRSKAQLRPKSVYESQTQTKVDRGLAVAKEDLTEFEVYKQTVTNLTRESWLKWESTINPNELPRGKEYELDHKFSIMQGFIEGISAQIIAHPANLEIVSQKYNRTKNKKCSVTIDQLLESVHSWSDVKE